MIHSSHAAKGLRKKGVLRPATLYHIVVRQQHHHRHLSISVALQTRKSKHCILTVIKFQSSFEFARRRCVGSSLAQEAFNAAISTLSGSWIGAILDKEQINHVPETTRLAYGRMEFRAQRGSVGYV